MRDAALRILFDVEPLAFCGMAGTRWRSRLGCPDGEAIEPRIDAPVAWKAEKGAVGISNRYHYPRYLYAPDLVTGTFSSLAEAIQPSSSCDGPKVNISKERS